MEGKELEASGLGPLYVLSLGFPSGDQEPSAPSGADCDGDPDSGARIGVGLVVNQGPGGVGWLSWRFHHPRSLGVSQGGVRGKKGLLWKAARKVSGLVR